MMLYTVEGEGADDTYSTTDLTEAREYARTGHDDPTWLADHEGETDA